MRHFVTKALVIGVAAPRRRFRRENRRRWRQTTKAATRPSRGIFRRRRGDVQSNVSHFGVTNITDARVGWPETDPHGKFGRDLDLKSGERKCASQYRASF